MKAVSQAVPSIRQPAFHRRIEDDRSIDCREVRDIIRDPASAQRAIAAKRPFAEIKRMAESQPVAKASGLLTVFQDCPPEKGKLRYIAWIVLDGFHVLSGHVKRLQKHSACK